MPKDDTHVPPMTKAAARKAIAAYEKQHDHSKPKPGCEDREDGSVPPNPDAAAGEQPDE